MSWGNYNWNTTASHYISDHKNRGQKNQENDGQTGSDAWTSQCLRKKGGGGGYGTMCGGYLWVVPGNKKEV